MSFTWEKLIEKFTAHSASGETFQVRIYQEVVGDTDTVKRVETTDGYFCNRIDDDTFEIVDLHLTIKRVK